MPVLSPPEHLRGIVTKYKGNGRKLGWPTANLDVETDLADGVYFGFADLNRFSRHPALIFVGVPITVGDKTRRVEAHLLDIPDEDYYGQDLKLEVAYFHRPNQAFSARGSFISIHCDHLAERWSA